MNKKAVSLVEVLLAGLLIAMAIIPVLSVQQQSTARVIETEKIQKCEHILESVKSELMTMPFKTFYSRAEDEGIDKNAIGPFQLTDGYYPITLVEIMKVQENYKDFKLVGTWSYSVGENGKPDRTVVHVDILSSFSLGYNGRKIERKKSFVMIRP